MSTTHKDPAARPSPAAALIVAALLIWGLQRFVPYGRLILYPFTLLSTWVHEMGHGLTACLIGGRFAHLDIYADASGLAFFSAAPGARLALVAAGGLLAPPLVGMFLLVLGRRAARPLLAALALTMVASLVLWVRTPVGWLTVGGLAVVCVAAGRLLQARGRLFFVQLLGLLLGLDTVTRADYLFVSSAQVGGQLHASDVAGIASTLGGPPVMWGVLIAIVSSLLLLLGLWSVLGGAARRAPTHEAVPAALTP